MPYVTGFLRVREGGGSIDNELPGDQPGIDNSLPGGLPPIGSTLPEPPPGIWPPPSFGQPIVPTNPIAPPPPGSIWPPPGRPPHVSGGPVPPHVSGQPVPTPPPTAGTPPPTGGATPPSTKPPSGTFWVVAGIPGLGWRYVCVDPSLDAGMPLPPAPAPKA